MSVLLGALKSKTIWINVLGLAGIVLASDQIKIFVSPEHAMAALAAVNIVLRFFTSTSLTEKAT